MVVVLLVVVVCVWCVCVCVCCGTLKKREKSICLQTRLRVYSQNVPFYAGTTRTCVETCARGAGTHGDVLNVHTEGVLYMHTGEKGRVSSVLLTKICPRTVITCFRGSPKKLLDHSCFQV